MIKNLLSRFISTHTEREVVYVIETLRCCLHIEIYLKFRFCNFDFLLLCVFLLLIQGLTV